MSQGIPEEITLAALNAETQLWRAEDVSAEAATLIEDAVTMLREAATIVAKLEQEDEKQASALD
jgi:hypothetical protein